MKKHKSKLKNFKNFGFLTVIFIFSLFTFNLKDAEASFTISRPSTHNLGLVGHWTFDGKNVVNGVALDSAGTNNGKLINIATSTFYAAGKIGQGFNFDGTNDYVSVGSAVNPGTSDFTLSAWFNPSIFSQLAGNDRTVFSQQNGAGTGRSWLDFDPTNNHLNSFLSGASSDSGYAFATSTWVHAVLVHNNAANTLTWYVNGAIQNTNTSIAVESATGNYILGANKGLNGPYQGKLDDVRIYNRALSTGEIKNLYNQGLSKLNKTPTNILTSGLVGHWTFDGGKVVNGVALDSAGTNNGKLINIATSTFYAAGKIGQGFNFDGTNDYVSVGDSANWALGGTFTIGAWIKPSAVTSSWIVGQGGVASTNFWALSYDSNSLDFQVSASDLTIINISQSWTPAAGNWYHVAVVDNNGTWKLFVNGAQIGTDTSDSDTVPNFAASLCIGNGTVCSNNYFNGTIDDVRIYNRALSAGEVKMLYNMGR